MNKHLKTLTLASFCLAVVGCGSPSSDSPAPVASPSATSEETTPTEQPAVTVRILPIATSTVVDRQIAAGEASAGGPVLTLEEILAAYPVLAQRVIALGTVDKIVETDARTIDLYYGDSVIMTLAYNEAGNGLTVRSSNSEFMADSITFQNAAAGGEQNQNQVVDSLHFVMSNCKAGKVPDKEEPGQEQEQDKGKTPDKKVEPVKEECASVEMTLSLKQVVEKQEQGKEQDQSKKEQPKDPGQEQDQRRDP